jgi:2-(1,2-epoxy-1,2-dihydrophenyl)acetyl-CoA isomerase
MSTALQTVDYAVADGVATITLNRPDALNAWVRELGEELVAALDRAADDPAVRVVVLTGAGRAFSSGADLKEGGEFDKHGKPDVLTRLRAVYNPAIVKVRTLPKPVVAAVNGPAVGIGCSLALAADLVIAADSAYFLLAFVNIGLTVDGGSSASLAARVGHARAFEMAFLGERIDARKAESWGLVNRVVADDELAAATGALTARLAAGPPGSYAATKKLINDRLYPGLEEHLDVEAVLQQERAVSADFMEGVLAFMQKRPANFTGE